MTLKQQLHKRAKDSVLKGTNNVIAALFPRLELRTLIIKSNNKWRWPLGEVRRGEVAENRHHKEGTALKKTTTKS